MKKKNAYVFFLSYPRRPGLPPRQAGIHLPYCLSHFSVDSRFRGNDFSSVKRNNRFAQIVYTQRKNDENI